MAYHYASLLTQAQPGPLMLVSLLRLQRCELGKSQFSYLDFCPGCVDHSGKGAQLAGTSAALLFSPQCTELATCDMEGSSKTMHIFSASPCWQQFTKASRRIHRGAALASWVCGHVTESPPLRLGHRNNYEPITFCGGVTSRGKENTGMRGIVANHRN